MLKVKYWYKYPYSAPVDRIGLSVQRDEKIPDTIAMYQTVTETLSAKKYLDTEKNMWVIEAEALEEFDGLTGLLKDVPRDGLVGEWLFFEGQGTKLYDLSRNGNNITLYGSTWEQLATGKWVSRFDGVDDYGVGPSPPTLNFTKFTVCVWVRFLGSDVSNNWIVNYGYRSATYIGWTVNTGSVGKLRFDVGNGSKFAKAISNIVPETGKWYFVAGVFDGSTAKLIVDGNAVATDSVTGVTYDSTRPLYIGRASWGLVFLLNGQIGLIRIYNIALSEDEIKTLYELEAPLFGITP